VFRVGAAYLVGAWLLVQVSATLFPVFGLGDTAVRIAVIIFVIGLIPALVLAWVFEFTPAGLKRESEVDRSQSQTLHTGKTLDRIIMVVLALALGYFAFDKFVLAESREVSIAEEAHQAGRTEALVGSYGEKSIAVLPFVNMSSDAEQEYFSDGLSEELLNLLAKIPDLRVIARTSSFAFKGEKIEIAEIAKKLNVAHVLEGSVRKSGNQVRITAQLIDARSDTHLWSETYDRPLDEIFAMQDEIAGAVVAQLKIKLLGAAPKTKETDSQAYALFLQARSLSNDLAEEGNLARMGVLLDQALERDPDYVDAITLYARFLWFGGQEVVKEDGDYQSETRHLIDRALAIDPGNSPALAWRALLAMVLDQDMYTAARYLEKAHQADPTNYETLWGSLAMTPLFGRANLSIEIGKYLIDHDPLCYSCYVDMAKTFWNLGDLNAAETFLRRGLALKPDQLELKDALANTLLLKGDATAALEIFESFRGLDDPGWMGELAALHDLGRLEEFEARLPAFLDFHAVKWPQLNAQLYAWIGDADNAFEWLDKTDKQMTWSIRSKLVNPFFVKLHDDPRWQALLEKYQMTEEHWVAIDLDLGLPK
jgi:TolB-like protein